jgi:cell division septation protein DedD
MLTEHDRPHRMDDPHDGPHDGSHDDEAPVATETPKPFPVLEEPSWLDDEEFEDMEAPRDSAFRGIWIGVAAAALTFALVFAIPHWLGWYDLGPATPRAKRELAPDSVISTVTAKPSGEAAPGPTVASAPAPPAAVTAPPVAVEPKAPAVPRESKPAPREAKAAVAPHEVKPAPAARESKPASAAAATTAGRRTFTVQIAAFKNARQAGRVAETVKRAGYAADVLRVESSAVPWVVRIGGYSTREQAESARDALARKGFRGGFII